MSTFRLFHNPRCSKSRRALELLVERGVDPELVLYLDTPPSFDELRAILSRLKLEPRDLMRKGEDIYKQLGLSNPELSSDALIGFMVENPVLIERPIFVTEVAAVIGRPPENVLTILSN